VNGTTFDQSLVWQHFEYTIDAAEILGVDEDKIPMWREKQEGLEPVQIGGDNQIKEWFEETTIGMAQAGSLDEVEIPNWRAGISPKNSIVAHRHPSHLMGLYPGTLISKDSDAEVIDAAMVSLNERGFGATSWGKSHKINAWARTGSGEKEAYYMMRSMLGGGNGGFMKNLFSSHGNNGNGTINYTNTRIFQIDGNFGYAAGFNEVLLQSHLGYVQFLPAIYEPAWASGSVKGLVARGNFVIDMDWTDGEADSFSVTSRAGGMFTGEYPDLAFFTVVDSSGELVQVEVTSKDRISFETEIDETYTLTPGGGTFFLFDAYLEDGKYIASFDNNTGGELAFNLILAIYDVDGKLVYTEVAPFDLQDGSDGTCEFRTDPTEYEDGYTVKVFCWDDAFVPLTEAKQITAE
jgi:alpha-L-fucosidase 2